MNNKRSIFTTLTLLLTLAPLGCIEPPDADGDPELDHHDVHEVEVSGEVAAVSPDQLEAPCATEAEVGDAATWYADMTAEELRDVPDGYLMMAPLTEPDAAGCNVDNVATIRVADDVAPDAKLAELCGEEQAGGHIVLRACEADELSLAELGMSSVTYGEETVGGCYWCTNDTCLNNSSLDQRKEGSTGPCFPNFWDTCCWAFNGGCCS